MMVYFFTGYIFNTPFVMNVRGLREERPIHLEMEIPELSLYAMMNKKIVEFIRVA